MGFSKEKVDNRRMFVWTPLFFALFCGVSLSQAPTSLGQLMSPQVLELKCEHLYEIQQRYLSRHILFRNNRSPNLERRTTDQLIKRLDGSKLYLLQGDVDKLSDSMKKLFGQLRVNDCTPIIKANQLLTKRMAERVAFVKKQLGTKFKFNPNVKLVLDPDKRARPKSLAELNQFHKNTYSFRLPTIWHRT